METQIELTPVNPLLLCDDTRKLVSTLHEAFDYLTDLDEAGLLRQEGKNLMGRMRRELEKHT